MSEQEHTHEHGEHAQHQHSGAPKDISGNTLAIIVIVAAIATIGVQLYSTYSLNAAISQLALAPPVISPSASPSPTVQPTASPQASPTPQPTQIDVAGRPTEGNANAKVTLIIFSDFQCSYCGAYEGTRSLGQGWDTIAPYPNIKKEYIDTGKIKFVFKQFPLSEIHPYAEKAAEASECALDQGKFWQMHDKMFQNQNALTVDDLKNYAKNLSLDAARFNTCLDSGAKAAVVQKDIADGVAAGVQGTPATFVNGQMVLNQGRPAGASPYEVFKQAIDAALAG